MTISQSFPQVLIAISLLTSWSSANARQQTVPVALIPLAATGKGAPAVAAKATAAVAKQLRHQQGVRLVALGGGRAERLHQCLQVADCIRGVSARLSVALLVTGYVTRLEQQGAFHVDLRIISESGEVLASDSFETATPAGAAGPAARSAVKLLQEGKSRVRNTGAGAGAAQGGTTKGAPLFSRSEAQSAASVIEGRDKENPLAPEPPKPPPTAAPGAGGAAAVVVKPKPSYHPHVFSRRYLTAWSVGIGGLAGLGAAVGFGVTSRRANTAAQDAPYHQEAWINHDKAQKNALVANILFGVGGAAVLTSAVLFLVECRKDVNEQRRAHEGVSLDVQVAREGGALTISGAF